MAGQVWRSKDAAAREVTVISADHWSDLGNGFVLVQGPTRKSNLRVGTLRSRYVLVAEPSSSGAKTRTEWGLRYSSGREQGFGSLETARKYCEEQARRSNLAPVLLTREVTEWRTAEPPDVEKPETHRVSPHT